MSRLALALAALALAGCDDGRMRIADGPPLVPRTGRPPDQLSHLRLFEWDAGAFRYNDRVVPYDLTTPLFTDYALKERAIYVPEGEAMAYDPAVPFALPVGSAIVKTFYFPRDLRRPDEDLTLIETRVLVHGQDGWTAWPYVWNAEQTEAFLRVGGETRAITFIDAEGSERTASYLVPQRNQCTSCHERNVGPGGAAAMTPIGPAARYLNRDLDYGAGPVNQLAHFAERGMLSGLPDLGGVPRAYDLTEYEARGLDAIAPGELDFAARSYLDINCAHCHDPRGTQGVTSQLFLHHDSTSAFNLGVCKRPGSAGAGTGGLTYDLVPGRPDESILVFRVETTEVGAMMPLLGRSLRHDRGAALVRAWVAAMPPVDCNAMEMEMEEEPPPEP
ncbi:MAG: hypothetical protein KF729_04615 [Sandaracinaceae bacterium]|nr:hypothetical protein [Sandaracinaceae bacterium]